MLPNIHSYKSLFKLIGLKLAQAKQALWLISSRVMTSLWWSVDRFYYLAVNQKVGYWLFASLPTRFWPICQNHHCGYIVLHVDKSPRHKVSLETSDWLKGDVNHSPYLFSNKIEKKFPLYQETYKPLAYSYGLFPVPNFLSWTQIWKSKDSTWMLLKKTTRLLKGNISTSPGDRTQTSCLNHRPFWPGWWPDSYWPEEAITPITHCVTTSYYDRHVNIDL